MSFSITSKQIENLEKELHDSKEILASNSLSVLIKEFLNIEKKYRRIEEIKAKVQDLTNKDQEILQSRIQEIKKIWENLRNSFQDKTALIIQNHKQVKVTQFEKFNLGKVLKETGLQDMTYDPDKGIFGLETLSYPNLECFKEGNEKIENAEILSEIENAKKRSELKKYFDKNLNQTFEGSGEAYNKVVKKLNELTQEEKAIKLRRNYSYFLSSKEFWTEITNNSNLNQDLDWLKHTKYSHYSSVGIWKTIEILKFFKVYCKKAKSEVDNFKNKIFNNIPIFRNKDSQTKIFFSKFLDYLKGLEEQIKEEKNAIQQAILVRLELANKIKKIDHDDILFHKVDELKKTGIFAILPFESISSLQLSEFYRFHIFLAKNMEQALSIFSRWIWFRYEDGIQFKLLFLGKNRIFFLPEKDFEKQRLYLNYESWIQAKNSEICFSSLVLFNMDRFQYSLNKTAGNLAIAIASFFKLEQNLKENHFTFEQPLINLNQGIYSTSELRKSEREEKIKSFVELHWDPILKCQKDLLLASAKEIIEKYLEQTKEAKRDLLLDLAFLGILQYDEFNDTLKKIKKNIFRSFDTLIKNNDFIKKIDGSVGNCSLEEWNCDTSQWFSYIQEILKGKEKIDFEILKKFVLEKQFIEIPQFETILRDFGKNEPIEQFKWKDWIVTILRQRLQVDNEDLSLWNWLLDYEDYCNEKITVSDWITKNLDSFVNAYIYLKEIFSNDDLPSKVLVNQSVCPVCYEHMIDSYKILENSVSIGIEYKNRLIEIDKDIKNYMKTSSNKTFGYGIFLLEWSSQSKERANLFSEYVAKYFSFVFQKNPELLATIPNDRNPTIGGRIDYCAKKNTIVEAALSQELVKLLLSKQGKTFKAVSIIQEKPDLLKQLTLKYYKKSLNEDLEERIDEYYYTYLQNLVKQKVSVQEFEKVCIQISKDFPFTQFPCSEKIKNQIQNLMQSRLSLKWNPLDAILIRFFAQEELQNEYHFKWLDRFVKDSLFAEMYSDPYRDKEYFQNAGPTLISLQRLYGIKFSSVLELINSFICTPKNNQRVWNMLDILLLSNNEQQTVVNENFSSLKKQYESISDFKKGVENLIENLKKNAFVLAKGNLETLNTKRDLLSLLSKDAKDYLGGYVYQSIENFLKERIHSYDLDNKQQLHIFLKDFVTFLQKIKKDQLDHFCHWIDIYDWWVKNAETILQLKRCPDNLIQDQVNNQGLTSFFEPLKDVPSEEVLRLLKLGLTEADKQKLLKGIEMVNIQFLNWYEAHTLFSLEKILSQKTENILEEERLFLNAYKLSRSYRYREEIKLNKNEIADLEKVIKPSLFKFSIKYSHWQQVLWTLFLGQGDYVDDKDLIMGVFRGKCKLSPRVSEQIKKYFCSRNQEGLRYVFPVNVDVNNNINAYFKYNPDFPGIEYAVRALHRYTIDPSMPYSELFRFPSGIGIQSKTPFFPVLITEEVTGIRLDNYLYDKESKGRWDLEAYSRRFLLSLLTNPLDGKPENEIVVLNGEKFQLVNIDNDQSFVPSVTIEKGRRKLNVKSIIFCFDEIRKEIDEIIIENFLRLDAYALMSIWLIDLQQQNNRYLEMFTPELCHELFYQNSENPIVMPILLPNTVIEDLYIKIIRIQNIFRRAKKENKKITHLELMIEIDPNLANFYEKVLSDFEKPMDRFYHLFKDEYEISQDNQNHIAFGTSTTGSHVLTSIYGYIPEIKQTKKDHLLTALQAHDKLKSIRIQHLRIEEIGNELLNGNLTLFKNLKVDHFKERVIESISPCFKEITIEIQKEILSAMKGVNFFRLNLKGCAALTDAMLYDLLRQSPQLVYLNISGCSNLTEKAFYYIAYNAPHLQKLSANNLPWNQISTKSWTNSFYRVQPFPQLKNLIMRNVPISYFDCDMPMLERLVLTEGEELIDLNLFSPNLRKLNLARSKRFNILGNNKLKKIKIPQHKLTNITFDDCDITEEILLDLFPNILDDQSFPQAFSFKNCSMLKHTEFRQKYPQLALLPLDQLENSYIQALQDTIQNVLISYHLEWNQLTDQQICPVLKILNKRINWQKLLLTILRDNDVNVPLKIVEHWDFINIMVGQKEHKNLKYIIDNLIVSNNFVINNMIVVLERFNEEEVISYLLMAMKSSDVMIRRNSTYLLRLMKKDREDVIQKLLEALNDEDSEVRSCAIWTLNKLAKDREDVIQGLLKVLKDKDEDPNVRSCAIQVLSELAKDREDVIQGLLKVLKDKDEDPNVRSCAIRALSELAKDRDDIIKGILESLKDTEVLIRYNALIALKKLPFRKDIFEGVVTAIDDSNESVRKEAFPILDLMSSRLENIEIDNESIIHNLLKALKDKDQEIRKTTVLLLITLGKDREDVIQALLKTIKDPNSIVRIKVIYALGNIKKDREDIIQALIIAFKNESDHFVRLTILKVLGELKKDRDDTIEIFLMALKDSDSNVRWHAVYSLKILQKDRQDIINGLLEFIVNSDGRERREKEFAIDALRNIKKDDSLCNNLLKKNYSSNVEDKKLVINLNSEVCEVTLEELRIDKNKEVVQSSLKALKDTEVIVKKAINALVNLRINIQRLIQELLETIQDPRTELCEAVISKLKKLKKEDDLIKELLKALETYDWTVNSEGFIRGLKKIIIKNQNTEISEIAISLLKEFKKDNIFIIESLLDKFINRDMLFSLVKSLSAIEKKDLMHRLLEALNDPKKRENVIGALGILAQDHEEIIETLFTLANRKKTFWDWDWGFWRTRRAAIRSLDNLLSLESTCEQLSDVLKSVISDSVQVMVKGIHNEWNDCFMNSIFQLVVHSPLRSFLSDANCLLQNSNRNDYEKIKEFFEMYLKPGENPKTNFLRQIFGYASGSQEDAVEFLQKLIRNYSIKSISSKIVRERVVEGNLEELVKNAMNLESSAESMSLDYSGKVLREEIAFIISLPIPRSEETHFQDLWNNMLHSSGEAKFTFENKIFESKFKETVTIHPNNYFFIQLNRFNNQREKVETKIDIQQIEIIAGQPYLLKGFILHEGTSQIGHYVTYLRIQGKWILFNDLYISEIDEKAALEKAKSGYLFYFEKQ